jgi:hypothetical protein
MYNLEIKTGCLLFSSAHDTIEAVWEHINYRKETEHSFSYTIKTLDGEIEAQGDFSIDLNKEEFSSAEFYTNNI